MQRRPKLLARQKRALSKQPSLWRLLLPLMPHLTTISPPNPAPETPKKQVQHLVYPRLLLKKTGAAAPCVASFASSCHSTCFLNASSTGSDKKHASAKGHDNESIATCPKCIATAAAKALLEQLQISKTKDTDFEEDPQADGGSNDDLEIIELDDDGDGVIGGESGDDSDDSSGNGSEIEVVEDN